MTNTQIDHHGTEQRYLNFYIINIFLWKYFNFLGFFIQVQAVTLSVDTSIAADVFLIDYGVEKKNVKFPRYYSTIGLKMEK